MYFLMFPILCLVFLWDIGLQNVFIWDAYIVSYGGLLLVFLGVAGCLACSISKLINNGARFH